MVGLSVNLFTFDLAKTQAACPTVPIVLTPRKRVSVGWILRDLSFIGHPQDDTTNGFFVPSSKMSNE